MTLSQVRLYTKEAFRSKGTVSGFKRTIFSIVFVRNTPAIPKLMVRDIGLSVVRAGGVLAVGVVVEVKIDVLLLTYINCFLNSKYKI